MIHDDFANPPAARRGKHGYKPMQFAVQPHFVKNAASVAFEPAVVIVQTNAGEKADQPVKHARRSDFVPRVMPDLFPPADNVQIVRHLRQKMWHLGGIVL